MDSLLDDDCSDDVQDAEALDVEKYQDQILECKLKMSQALYAHDRPPSPSYMTVADSSSSSQKKRSYKLPKTEIKKFNGEVTEWLSWWAQFQKIHEDEELLFIENYPKAIKALRHRFGKEKILKRFYGRELLKLIIKNSREKLKIGVTFDLLEGHLRALESLGITPDQMDVILFPMVESCMPEETLVA